MSEEKDNRQTSQVPEGLAGFLWEAPPETAVPEKEEATPAAVHPAPEPEIVSPAAPDPEPEPDASSEPEVRVRRRVAAEEPSVEQVREPKKSAVRSFVEVVEIFVGAFIAAILVLTLLCRTGVVKGSSMEQTMYEGDRYLISDLFYTPKQGDIVVFRPGIVGEDDMWIKRVIATAGQEVYINPDTYQVFVDGKLLDEPYLSVPSTIPHSTPNPIVVPEGCVYLMGDYRAVSHDSRYADVGCVELGQIAGRVLFRFWPFNSIGFCS